MANLRQDFEINYPLTHKVVRDLKIVRETVGELIVTVQLTSILTNQF
jgi:hypothetical protein